MRQRRAVFFKKNSLLVIQVVVVCVVVVEGGDSAGEASQVLQAALGGATYKDGFPTLNNVYFIKIKYFHTRIRRSRS